MSSVLINTTVVIMIYQLESYLHMSTTFERISNKISVIDSFPILDYCEYLPIFVCDSKYKRIKRK